MIQSIAARCLREQSKAVLLAVALALSVPAVSTEAATVQVGFSPEGSARTLVLVTSRAKRDSASRDIGGETATVVAC